MTDPDRQQTAITLQREIAYARADLVQDIDRLRTVVKERTNLVRILQDHPRATMALSVALGVAGITTFALLWRKTKKRRALELEPHRPEYRPYS